LATRPLEPADIALLLSCAAMAALLVARLRVVGPAQVARAC
jgi:hypothetical protein